MQSVALKGFRLSVQQNRLWALQRESPAYYIQYALKLEGELDTVLFQQAFKQAINRHTILRTRFQYLPNMEIPVQVILEHSEASCPMISLSGLSDSDQLAQYNTYFVALQNGSFNLEQDIALQALLLQMVEHQHILILKLPALCADPSTFKNFISDLQKIYMSLLGSANILEDPLQYTDVSAWQDELLQEEDAEEQIAFWRKHSLSILNTIRLPFEQVTEKGIREQCAFAPLWLRVPLEPWLQQLLWDVARRFSVSLEALLLACWQTLLWRLTDADPFLLGVSCDGRPYEELSSTLGLYSRVVPLTVPFSPDMPFSRLLPLIQAALLEVIEKQLYFSWPSASQWSEREPAFFPLSFEFEAWPASLNVDPLNISLLRRSGCWELFALKLNVLQVGDSLQLDISIDPARIATDQAEQLVELLPVWLAKLCQMPQISLSAIPLLPASLQNRVRNQGTAPRQAVGPSLLHERFTSQAQQSPQALAAICGEERLSYQQLNVRANRLAHFLRQQGVGANRIVALCLPRSLDQLVALLAVLKAGGAYAPLDPDHPSARLSWQLTDLQPHLLLTREAFVSRVAAWNGPRLCLDQIQEQLDAQPQTELDVIPDPQDLAYLIWTSGSTGQPKAVMVPHQAVSNYTEALCVQLGVETGWHFGTVSTLAADLGNTSIFCSLVSGGCLHILPYETLTSAQALHHYLLAYPLDVLKIVPSHLSALLSESQGLQLLPSRYLLLGGERLSTQLLARLKQEEGSCQVINHYGPTETTIGAVTNVLGGLKSAEQKIWAAEVPIGRAIANEQAYILDRYQHLLPLGVVGELYIGGAGVARGYYGRAEQTSERFMPDGWSEEAGQRMYRTGDLARVGEGGQIEYIGRKDNQVKLRGYRIELGEIEAVMRRHANVRECVVLLREDEPSNQRLVAYVVARQQPGPTGGELREFLEGQLPTYMLPAVFLGLRVIPLTSNGKIDVRQLPTPAEYEETRSTPYVPARTPTEEILVSIWEDVLKVKPIGIHDHFTNLGGHSLLATQIVSQIRAILQVEIPLRSLFEAPTIIKLAERVEQAFRQDRGRQVPPLMLAKRTQELPLSFAQQRLWFLQQLQPDSSAYNVPVAGRLRGILSVAMLQRSLQELLHRHENLRTTFPLHNGYPIQCIEATPVCFLPLVDFGNLPPDRQVQEVRTFLYQEANRPFDLARGPLARSAVLRLSSEEHVLGVTMHHIISDGWSRSIMVRELASLYNAFVTGQPSSLPALPIQYADFALWQRNWLQGEVLEEQMSYWEKQLVGLAPLDLPTDHPRPTVQTFRGSHQALSLSPVLCDDLRALSQRAGVTLFMTLLAAFQVLLARYSGQSDIVIGTPIANRNHAEIEGLIGFFVNTLVLRTDLSDNPSFQHLLSRVREVCLGAYAHQDIPFEKLVEALQPERDLSRSPFFQVMLNMQQVAPSALQYNFHGLAFESLIPENVTTKFDLTLSLTDSSQGLQCGIEYNTDLFEAATISRLLAHWQTLLQAVVEQPHLRLSDLPILSESERHNLLVDWNQTRASYPVESCIHALFETRTIATPDAVAVVHGDECLTYTALNRWANLLAHRLRNSGVRPDVLVGICLERSLEMLIGMLGILKAGGAYVPLDPAYPKDRLVYMLKDSQLPVLLTQPAMVDIFPSSDTILLSLSDLQMPERIENALEVHNPLSFVEPEHLAYVIYTSGSTGQPKGIAIRHRAVVNFLNSMSRVPGITSQDSVLAVTSLSFDIAILELLLPLTQGARVHIFDRDVATDGVELALQLAVSGASIMQATPTMWRILLDAGWSGDSQLKMLCGGEALALDLAQRLRQKGGSLWNMYGPTETTIWSTICRVAEKDDQVTIGRAIDNTQLYILDHHFEPVPIGVPGELYIGGEGLARGYLGRAELSAEMFVPNPFSEGIGERMYRTGDSVRYLSDGTIEYLGRVDQQVKVRGHRIELREIEVVLRQYVGVDEAVVVVREDKPEERALVAYIVSRQAEQLTSTELRSYLRKKVPEYMVPSSIVMLEFLPLTPNKKVDRRALPRPSALLKERCEGTGEARNPIEEVVEEIWADVLGRRQVGINESFFEVGGHSLLATQLIARLRAAMQVELPLRSLFEAPTIAGLAEQIALVLRKGQYAEHPSLQPAARTQNLPLSFAQQRLWFLDQLDPGSAAYNIHNAVHLQGALDMVALVQSLTELIRRHESLHTNFQIKADRPVQIIVGVDVLSLPLVDLTTVEPSQAEMIARQISFQEARQPFALASGPLVRTTVVRLSPHEHVLLMTMHHIIADGWSMRIMMREVAALYNAFVTEQTSSLPALPIQYADFALWQRNWLQGEVLEEQVSYWQAQLAGLAPLDLLTDRPRPAEQTFIGAQQRLFLPPELRNDLRALSQREGVTLFMTLLAAFQVLLARYSGRRDIAVGTDIANRTHAEIEGLIGFFANTLVLRTRLTHDLTFQQLLTRVREVCLGAYAHQDVPFEKLVEVLQPERDLSRSPLFQVFLSLQQASHTTQAPTMKGLTVSRLIAESAIAKFDLNLSIAESEQGLYCVMEYNTDLFDARTINQLLHHFHILLANCVRTPQEHLGRLPLLNETERHQLLIEWNSNTAMSSMSASMHTLFEEQAARTPERIAVVYQEEQLSYDCLNRKANQLAHQLARQGVAPEVLVGLYLERSLDMLISILAIFKAGGAYLPLDPMYPRERVEFILADAQVQVLLTKRALSATLPPSDAILLRLDDWYVSSSFSEELPIAQNSGEQLAYMIYTSGSTGRPKGVMVHQAGMLNHLLAKIDTLQLQENDIVAQTASHCFDISVWQFLAGLLVGGCVQIISDEITHDPSYLLRMVIDGYISILELVPSLLSHLLDEVERTNYALFLRWLIVTGEAVSAQLCLRWLHYYPGIPLLNAYGPTECSDDVTHAFIEEMESVQESNIPIGRPISNIQVYLLDEYLAPVPVGVAGQLYIGGVGVGRGYWQSPARTAESFLPDPYGSQVGGRLYRTGDLALYQADSQIRFLGRIDEQVKIRGFRIELGEIKAALLTHPQVVQCAVIDREVMAGDIQLVAYIVVREYPEPSPAELQDYLRSKLPAYMVPSFFVLLEAIPLTPNGKVDRRALPAPDAREILSEKQEMETRTPFEEVIQTIFQELLRREYIGREENFFELGGHSLLATQVVARIRTMMQVELPLRSLFEAPTIAGLAQRVQQAMWGGRITKRPALQPVTREDSLPLSFAQQRLWFLDQLEPENAAYNIAEAIRLRGSLNKKAFEQSLAAMCQRHESLRTSFQLRSDQPVQVITPLDGFCLPCIDLSQLPEEVREAQLRQMARQEARRPFDLSDARLLRVMLVTLMPGEQVMLVTMHHIISDGWSMRIFVREIRVLYEAFLLGQPSPLPALPIQYADFALWQRSWLQGKMLEEQMHYWQEQLVGLVPLNLPTDHPHPAVQTYRGAHQSLHLSPELGEGLQALSQEEGVTLFMTVLAAFQVLLARYCGQSDIAVGTPIANRTHAEIEGLIGFFVNTLVLRTDLSDNPSFLNLLARVREVCLGAYTHQDVPFEKLVDVLQPQRDLSRSPLFQVMLNLQQESRASSEKTFEGLVLESLPLESPTAKFDLMLSLTNSTQGMQCVVEYNIDLFEASTISRLLSHWQILLTAIVANPQQHVATLSLLSEDEQRRMLVDWNATRIDFLDQPLLHQLIENQVKRTPDAIALVFEDEQISFAQLDHCTHLLALCLHSLGVGPDVLVGVCMHRSLDLVISLLAILKAGGAYVPLDPTYPQERLALMLANSQVEILITHSTLHEQFISYSLKILQLDTLWRSLELVLHSSSLPYTGLCPDHLAYMIYTSGSTGQPKGVMNIHRAICNRLLWLQTVHPLMEGDRVLQKTPVCFDVSVWEIFWPLLSGACLVIARPEGHRDNQYLATLIEEEAITAMHFVPSMLQVFLQEQVEEYCRSLRLIVSSGEALPRELARHCLRQIPQVQLYNLYGPTEAAVEVTAWPFHEHREEVQVPIGYPISNIKIHLLDPYLQPVPIGVVGDLYIGGVGLARGYWQYPALTAEKFIPDPYSEQGSGRLYSTGDRARYRGDGAIEYLGRLDEQVKVRGFRIELGDIENALLQHPGLLECVVIAREETAESKRLVAYVVGKTVESVPASRELRAFLQERLPEYMIPAFFVRLDALPLMPNGKLDRRALPEPGERRFLQEGGYLSPRTDVEQVLAVIWVQVLRTSHPIGIEDNFFDLGGDSILGLQIIARARQQGLHLTIKHLFQHQTIAALGTVVGQAGLVKAEQSLVRGAFPLTPIQHWFFSHSLMQPYHWNQARLLEVPSDLDVHLVARAVEVLLSHHDALRLRFHATETGWQQASADPEMLLPFVEVDLAMLPLQKHKEAIGTALDQAQTSLNFVTGPLLRVVFVRRGSTQANLLFLAIHHLAIDGVSWRLLLEDLVSAIEQIRQGQSAHLPIKTSSFKSWAEQMQIYAQSSALQQEQAYWLAQERQEVHPLPQDRALALVHNTEASAQLVSVLLSENETRVLLNDVIPATHAQMNELLLTALVQSLADWTGATYVLVDLEGHGRESLFADLDVSRTVGWFTSLFPLLVNLKGVQSVRERLEAVKAQYRALPNHGIGYGILRYLSRDETLRQRLVALPQAQVLFNYHGHFDQSLVPTSMFRPTRFPTGATQDPQGRRSHLLSVTGSIRGGQLQLLWEYSEAFYQRSTIEGLMQRLVEVLHELIAHAQRQERVNGVDVNLSQEQLEQILTEMDLGEEE